MKINYIILFLLIINLANSEEIEQKSIDYTLFTHSDFNSKCSNEKIFSLFPPFTDVVAQITSFEPLEAYDSSDFSVKIYQKTKTSNTKTLSYNSLAKGFLTECMPIYFTHEAELYPAFTIEALKEDNEISIKDKIVLSKSDTKNCALCHTSNSFSLAKPAKGWSNKEDNEIDYKLNILRLHDQNNLKKIKKLIDTYNLDYDQEGLEATSDRKKINCSDCHRINAISRSGLPRVSSLTEAIHKTHMNLKDPLLISGGKTCITCHPSKKLNPIFDNNDVMHTIGKRWVKNHGDFLEDRNSNECTLCHGYDYDGSSLSKVAKGFTFRKQLTFNKGDNISCYDCHKKNSDDWDLKSGFKKK